MTRFKEGDVVVCNYKRNTNIAYPTVGQEYRITMVHESGNLELAGVSPDKYCHWTPEQFTLCSRQEEGEVIAPPTHLARQVGGSHYQDYQIQPITFFIQNAIPFTEASICKYALRHKSKNGKEDLLKAQHLIDILIEEYYPGE